MKRPWLAFPLLLALACGGSDPETTTGEGDTTGGEEARGPQWDDPLALVPDGYPAIVRVDVARFRASPYYSRIMPILEQQLGDQGHWRVILEQSALVAAGLVYDERGAPTSGVVAVRGQFQPRSLEELVRREAGTAGEGVAERTVRDNRVLDADEASFVESNTGTWIIGDHGSVDGAIALAYAPGTNIRNGTRHQALAQRIQFDSGTASGVIELSDGLRENLKQEHDPTIRLAGDTLVRAAGWIDLASGLSIRVDGEATSAQGAEQLAQSLRARLADASSDVALNLVGVAGYLRQIQVGVEGTHVVVTVALSHEDTERLLGMAGMLFQ